MTQEARRRNIDAAHNVIALVTAYHHGYDDTAAELISTMTEPEMAVTLINAAQSLADAYRVDAVEMGMLFDQYIQHLAAAIANRGAA